MNHQNWPWGHNCNIFCSYVVKNFIISPKSTNLDLICHFNRQFNGHSAKLTSLRVREHKAAQNRKKRKQTWRDELLTTAAVAARNLLLFFWRKSYLFIRMKNYNGKKQTKWYFEEANMMVASYRKVTYSMTEHGIKQQNPTYWKFR